MSRHLATVDEPPSDAELISAVRSGDTDAYGELFARHVDAARRLGRQLVSAGDVDDLVSEAFAKVLHVLQRGGGPDLAFRAYLLTAVRRLHVDRIRLTARLHTTDDLTPFDPGVPFRDTAVEGFESDTAARAFASLPERWQLVLWHTEVERQKPAEVAVLLGMTANSVSALAYRAREGLRQAYLSLHAQDVDEDACARTRANLGAYVRGGLSRRDSARVEQHLEGCRPCAAIYLELSEVNSRLGAVLAPLLLGTAAAAYLGSAGGGTAAAGGLLVLLGRAKDVVVANASTAAVSGAAAAAVVAAALVVGLQPHGPDVPTASEAPPPPAPSGAPASPGTAPGDAPTRPAGTRLPPSASAAASRADGVPASAPGAAAPSTAPSPPATGPSTPPSTTPPTTTPPTTTPPTTAPSTPAQPVVHVDVDVSAGPDGVGVGASAGALGVELPPVQVNVPVPVGGSTGGPLGGLGSPGPG
ncbi:sigma-70 family RNA polymerase sigma factor [Nocardioides sp.]|uniref:sigma-70 family RNA polymerase sigma factor n=1 Tax=Nocardioides sp. TaxID=35761 RepID=UPI003783E151